MRDAKVMLRHLLGERLIYGETIVDGHVDHEDALTLSADDRNAELRFNIVLFEA